MESIMPGIEGQAYGQFVAGSDVPLPPKAGPCAKFVGFETFMRLRARLDNCATGCRLAKDRAAESLTKVMIPESLDYPA